MNVGIIGAGFIGAKRADVIMKLKKDRVISVFDIDRGKSAALAKKIGSAVAASSDAIFKDKNIDAVIIATVSNASADLCLEAIRYKKHILCEKPLGINYAEAKKIYLAAKKNK